jgi:GAF domain-containing protein
MNYKEAAKKIKEILDQNKENKIQEVVDYLQSQFEAYTWVGIYIVKNNMLHLGPWNGPHATEHTKIPIGHGICGSAAKTGKTENISDVQSDDRYLSCFISTRSEIVVPITFNHSIIGEIDIDSDQPDAFTTTDERFLKEIADMLAKHIHNM